MKKTYMIPEMIQVKLKYAQPILTQSVENLNGEASSEMVGFSRETSFGGDEE